jgi:hypothetical protein
MTHASDKTWLVAALVLLGTGLALFFLVRTSGTPPPDTMQIAANYTAPVGEPHPERILQMLSPGTVPRLLPLTNGMNPFFTIYFQPPPAPPPITTRKVELMYQGFFETTQGERRAFLRVGTNTFIGAPGTNVIANYSVAQIEHGSLTLTNESNEPTVLNFRAKAELIVPVE